MQWRDCAWTGHPRAGDPEGNGKTKGNAGMRTVDLPLDTWVVVEGLAGGEVTLLSKHATQLQAETERDRRNAGLQSPRFRAVRALAPIASQQACAAVVMQQRE